MKSIASIPSEAIDTHPKTPSSSSSPKHVSSIFVPLPILPHTPSLNAAPHQQRHQHQHRSSSSSSITLSPGSSTTPQSPSHPHSIAGPDSKCDLEIIEQTPIFKSKETAKSWKVLAGCCIIACKFGFTFTTTRSERESLKMLLSHLLPSRSILSF